MVATTFAADTPLVVAGLVAKYGVAGNWLWWNGAISGILTVFFFSRLWRRAGVLTDVEFAELRYGGRPAAVLRGFRALYLALPINLIIMGWVTRAMVTILEHHPRRRPVGGRGRALRHHRALQRARRALGRDRHRRLPVRRRDGAARFSSPCWRSTRSAASRSLVEQSAAHFGSAEAAFGVIPPTDQAWLPLSTLLVFLAVQWWAAWYPGAEPGGGGLRRAADPLRQGRAPRPARDAVVQHRPLRASAVAVDPGRASSPRIRYPGLANPEEGYVRVMVDVLPSPFKGLLLAAFAAAYMSTISTHLNWGASYLVNDVYLRFMRPDAGPRAQVIASRARHGAAHGAVAGRHGHASPAWSKAGRSCSASAPAPAWC